LFTGSVCGQVRDWFRANAGAFAGRRVLSGCCGNFTIETVLSQAPDRPGEIISNDVSLYSSSLGAYFTGTQLTGTSIAEAEYAWLETYLQDAESMVGAIVVLLEAAPFSSCRTAYHRRIYHELTDNFESYHQQAVGRLQKRRDALHVSEFVAADVKDFFERRQDGDVFLSFMPTYAGGYEKLYQFLGKIIAWQDSPSYEIMDLDGKAELLARVHESGSYVHIDDVRRDEMKVVGIVDGGLGRPVYIHSDLDDVESEVYRRGSKTYRRPKVPLLQQDEVLDDLDVSFVALDNAEFAWVRDQHLSRNIMPADPSWRFGICVGGKLLGLTGFARGKDGETYYMMCDLAVASNVYRRLSKLICMVANTKEMHKILRQQTGRFWDTFTTTAFTKRPVSMKYRGVLTLLGRNKKEGKLNYQGNFSGSIAKAVKKWQKMEKKAKA